MKNTFFAATLIFLSCSLSLCWAEEQGLIPYAGTEYLSGYGRRGLRESRGEYRVVPLYVDFYFDLKPWLARHNLHPKGLVQLAYEPFISYVYSPEDDAECGANLVLKLGFVDERWKLQPYFKIAVGGIYMTMHIPDQSTQLNFNEYIGFGAQYHFSKDTAFTAEYRLRHLSNAEIKQPNAGLDTNFVLIGIRQLF